MENQTRNSNYSVRKIPLRKRVKILYGEHENYGRYYKCWNCGFIIDSDNKAFGGRGNGVSHIEFTIAKAGRIMTGDVKSITPSVDGVVAMRLGADGEPYTHLVHHLKPEVGQGCPFCGILDWK